MKTSIEQYWPLGGIEAATKLQVPVKTGTTNGAIILMNGSLLRCFDFLDANVSPLNLERAFVLFDAVDLQPDESFA